MKKISYIYLLLIFSINRWAGIEPINNSLLNQVYCHIDGTTEYFIFKNNGEVLHGNHYSGTPSPYSYLKVDWVTDEVFEINEYNRRDNTLLRNLGSFNFSDSSKNTLIRRPWQARDYFSIEACD